MRQIKAKSPKTLVEILTPDFRGAIKHVRTVVESKPDVFGQNIETVRRLTQTLRDRRAGYKHTLPVMRIVKEIDPTGRSKSSILVGMGDTYNEVIETMRHLRDAQVDLLAIGQYLQLILATNNLTSTPQAYIDKLAGMGVRVSPDEILVSSQTTARFLAHQYPRGTHVHVFGMLQEF